MERAFRGVVTLLIVAGLVTAVVAVATGGGPQVDQPAATIIFDHAKFKFRSCEGQDGFYSENKVELTGTSTGDSRLTGAVEAEYSELVNVTQETGPQAGRITIEDASSGARKADGKFDNAGPLDFTQGVIAGRVRDEGTGSDEEGLGAGALIANWRVLYGGNGSITAQIGGDAADSRLPTALWSGACKGKFEEVEIDLPPPDAVAAQSVGSWRAGAR
jgi:hypothetical protein